MRVLTDDPAAAAGIVADSGWQRDAHLSAREARIVRALGGTAVWSQVLEPPDRFWSTVVVVSHSDGSQFQALDQLLARGERIETPTAALALSGTGFRGQRDRKWEAPRGNLYLTAAVPVDLDVADVGPALSMLPTIASVDAIVEASSGIIKPGIKWVNDILLDDQKVGGVLSAAHTTARRIDDVVWGIGINVEVAPVVDPTPFVPATTCLQAAGDARVTVAQLFWALLRAIAERHMHLRQAGRATIYEAYRRHSIVVGRVVRVWDEAAAAPFAEGVVADITPDLGLQLRGRTDAIARGRLQLMHAGAEKTPIDRATVAAIAATVAARFPGARVTHIEADA